MDKNITCIVCPIGCVIQVKCIGKEIEKTEGASCEKGERYVQEEIFNPMRILTTTVRVVNGDETLVSVKTKKPVPKPKLKTIVKKISKFRAIAPIRIGQKLFDIDGIEVVATKNIKRS